MRRLSACLTAAVLLLSNAAVSAAAASNIEDQTRLFLDAYARGDRTAILRSVDPGIAVYGSDASEVLRGAAALEEMIANDQRLWAGQAHIGAMQHVSVANGGELASIFFDAPFSVGGHPPVLVRFAMVWKRMKGGWRLVQSSNVAPTQGESAAELLKGKSSAQ